MTVTGRQQLRRYGVGALFHITHRDNAAGMARDGILSHRRAHEGSGPVDISLADVQDIRQGKRDPIHERLLHDYAPLYFRARNPMLYLRQERQDELAVIHVEPGLLLQPDVIFTDGNAASERTSFFTKLSDLRRVDWACLRAQYWTEFEDGKRKRCAEVLVPDRVAPRWIRSAAVHSDETRQIMRNAGWRWPIQIKPKWFF